MSERMTLRLWNAQQGHGQILAAWERAKALLMAGHRLVLEIKPESRSLAQNRLLHALLQEISVQVEWAGSKREPEVWKRLLTAAWLRARGEHVDLLPALDGHGVDVVFKHTSRLSVAECSELCEFVMAWAAEHGVTFSDARDWQVDPATGEIVGGAA